MAMIVSRLSSSVRALLVLAIVSLAAGPAWAAMKIQEVTSPEGVTAWLVEDYSVPLVAIRFAFEGGSTQDPAGKEGLANLMSGLFDEGAGELDSEAFQIRLDDSGAEMGFSVGRDAFYGSMRMLAETKDEAFELLRLAIEAPRFDAAPLDRIRSQILSSIASEASDPETAAQRQWRSALYGSHPYAREEDGDEKSLTSISADDLRNLHRRLFSRGRLHVGVVGAIDAETLKIKLDLLFGGLPADPDLVDVPDIETRLGQQVRVDYDLPQTSLRLAYPSVGRKAPDFFAAYLMNHILGGGTFSSRLFEEVREKRGLAYSIGSSLAGHLHANSLVISTATRSDRAAETLAIIKEVVRKVAEEGPTEAELAGAKKYIVGSYPINNLESSASIASTLVELQLDGLPIDYMDKRAALIEAVRLDEIRAIARKLLTVEPSVLTLGPKTPAAAP